MSLQIKKATVCPSCWHRYVQKWRSESDKACYWANRVKYKKTRVLWRTEKTDFWRPKCPTWLSAWTWNTSAVRCVFSSWWTRAEVAQAQRIWSSSRSNLPHRRLDFMLYDADMVSLWILSGQDPGMVTEPMFSRGQRVDTEDAGWTRDTPATLQGEWTKCRASCSQPPPENRPPHRETWPRKPAGSQRNLTHVTIFSGHKEHSVAQWNGHKTITVSHSTCGEARRGLGTDVRHMGPITVTHCFTG